MPPPHTAYKSSQSWSLVWVVTGAALMAGSRPVPITDGGKPVAALFG